MVRVLLLLFSVGVASAQDAYVQQFYASDLQLVPGKVLISTGDPVIIDFYGAVDTVLAGQPNPLTIDQLETGISLLTDQRSGTTPLTVEVDGTFLLFEVEIRNDDQRSRIYRVAETRERAYSPSTAILPVPETEPPTPTESESPTPSSEGGTLTLVGADNSLFFTYTNTTGQRVALDPADLTVTQDGRSVPIDVTKDPLRNLVSPGEQQRGVIALNNEGPVTVAWEVLLLGEDGGTRTTLGGTANVE